MKKTPDLNDNEVITYDHIPSLRVFRKVAFLALLISLIPTAAFAIVWPDTIAPVVPIALTCVLLLQERVTFGRYRAWITNQRVILQGGRDAALSDVTEILSRFISVRLKGADVTIAYVEDKGALVQVIQSAQQGRI